MDAEKFETWAIVEVMGHQSFAGYVTEQSIGGAAFIRVDVPTHEEGDKPFTKLFGGSSIYAITPCSEELAHAYSKRYAQKAITAYLPELYPPKVLPEPGRVPCDEEIEEIMW